MSLQDKLDQRRIKFENSAPADVLNIMHKATNDLGDSGIIESVLKKGGEAPEFSLPDQTGNRISSATLLKNGPLVINFFRGGW
ncbi:MAG: hypothetical protein ABIJ59_05125 [Pseudomonadota bacterium]